MATKIGTNGDLLSPMANASNGANGAIGDNHWCHWRHWALATMASLNGDVTARMPSKERDAIGENGDNGAIGDNGDSMEIRWRLW
jgi:hypothetical protein